jgi:DNA sulfur modification protein DndB
MNITFPAMRGRIGGREYFVAMIKLANIPKLFQFRDWAELPPEQRAQRVVQKSRIPEIAQYILENEDGYLFSSLTASFDCDVNFVAFPNDDSMGHLTMPLEANMVINDGQHRRAAIEEALKENPHIGDETISVVLFPFEDLDRMQQMFSDLNRTARKTSKSLDILYNHRDLLSQVVTKTIECVPSFCNMVDKDRVSLPLRSPKLFTLGSLYDASKILLEPVTDESYEDKLSLNIEFWNFVAAAIPEWGRAARGDLRPSELRQEYVHSHAVVMWALGAAGRTLLVEAPNDWQVRIGDFGNIDWRRTNREWQGVAMSGANVVNRRQSRSDTASFLKDKLGLPLTPAEERSLKGARNPAIVIEKLKAMTRGE